jgi:UDP-glucose 4-epimerase
MNTLAHKRILVTGGAGFIGSHIVEDLVEAEADVVVYDDFSSGLIENLSAVRERIEVVEGDILDRDKLDRATANCDFISHQAAQLEIIRATDDPFSDLQINTIGTLNVLLAAEKNGVQKVINASSACIYGQTNKPTSEDFLPAPNWTYGVSKLAAERYAGIFHSAGRVPTVSLRYSIVYGEREWYRRAVTLFIKRVIQDLPPVVFGAGSQIRDFLHVSDVVRLHRNCLETEAADGMALNVGSGKATTIAELAGAVIQAGSKELSIEFEDVKEGQHSARMPDKRRNNSDLGMMHLDCARARSLLNWQPKILLEEGLSLEIKWAEQNLQRWDKVNYTLTAHNIK